MSATHLARLAIQNVTNIRPLGIIMLVMLGLGYTLGGWLGSHILIPELIIT